MAIQLPPAFLERMEKLLGDEYPAFLDSYQAPHYAGIRANLLKINQAEFEQIVPFPVRPIRWCGTGYYTEDGLKPGKHPYYHAGLYYIQEPSAMAPVEALGVQPGDRVLDLCAAPGGKSTQIAGKLQGTGVLVTNDISAERTKALAKNIELYGVRNAVVLNEAPDRIAKAFPHYFNRILIDAPCSGEGMFRKDADMVRQWEKHSVVKCEAMQKDILRSAAELLAPGGTIVYSTCTFAPEENEGMIAAFISRHPEFSIIPIPQEWGISGGRPEWLKPEGLTEEEYTAEAASETSKCGRLWPHLIEGEGHFVAVLRHNGAEAVPVEDSDTQAHLPEELLLSGTRRPAKDKQSLRKKKGLPERTEPAEQEMLGTWSSFAASNLKLESEGEPIMFGGHVYLSPVAKEQLNGLKTVRPGWYVGTVKNGRFTPGHPLAAALRPEEAMRSLSLSSEEGEAVRYLKGETLAISPDRIQCSEGVEPKGYVLVCIDGYSAGWGKWLDGMLKNEYPAGWRWT
ncbi:RsmB/NOP family class I SAM-dependent RNA methyltransferase [Paenibacillus sp. YPG26]|uniref:RsmB/NOP family class I SAM-dependent RNA methyltransferase n=1 Tax=Paenibacillus sp. YPG26 TaxID=2878915 RepID=UPI00203E3BF8|nr:RsmB/NOP family class I SAM-dependent RNA methyltransferase [Paenibacillus sp. YPG26]USB32213.1 RsmB/NOP family class I SAM-dependent RNA methyltransferase [Paenibacillus sp. YPG26]